MPAVGPFSSSPEPEGRLSRVGGAVREAIGGDKRAAIRRILLWVLVIVLVASSAPAWLTLLPVALLMATDGLL